MAEFDLGRAQGEIIIGTDSARKSVDGLTSSINSSISKAGQQLARTGTRLSLGVTLPLVAVGTAAVNTSLEFTKTMNTMAAVAEVPQKGIESLRALAIKMGQDTVFSANEAGQAMLELSKAGVSVSDIMGGALKNTLSLATAGDLDLATSATIASNAMNTFGLSGKESQQAVDALAGAANASSADVSDLAEALAQGGSAAALAGQTIQETAGFLGEMAQAGIKGSDAGTSLKTFLLSLVPTTNTAKEAIKKLGLEFVNADGSIKSLSEVSQELQDHIGKLTPAQQQLALKTIFGTDAYRAAAIATKNGAEGLKVYTDAASKAGTASEVAAGKLKGLPGVIETLKGSIDTALLTLGDTLQPIVEVVANAITDLLNLFIALPGPIKTAIVVIGILAAAAGPLLFVIGQAAVLFSVLLGPVGLIIGAIGLLIGLFIKLNGGVSGTIKVIGNFIDGFTKAIAPAISAIQQIGVEVGEAFTPLFRQFQSLGKAAKGQAGNALGIITDAINGFAQVLLVIIPPAARGLAAFIQFLVDGFPKVAAVVSSAVSAIMPLLTALGNYIANEFTDIWNALVKVWNENLKPALADLKPLWQDLVSIFRDLSPVLKVVGAALGVLLVGPLLLLLKVLPPVIRVTGLMIQVMVKLTRVIVAAGKLIIQFATNVAGAIARFVIASVRQMGIFVAFVQRIPGDVAHAFIAVFNAVVTWVSKADQFIINKWNGIVHFFAGLGGKLANAGRHMWDWIVDGAKAIANSAIGIINSIISKINSFQIHIHVDPPGPGAIDFDWNGPGIPSIPGFAHGIKNFLGGLAIVGEGGPELVALPHGSDVLPNRILRGLERNGSFNRTHASANIAAPRDLRGVEVIGTIDTPFGPAQIRGMIRDEIEDHETFNSTLNRMNDRHRRAYADE
jgi:TP901 family phage tail tape measure protein